MDRRTDSGSILGSFGEAEEGAAAWLAFAAVVDSRPGECALCVARCSGYR